MPEKTKTGVGIDVGSKRLHVAIHGSDEVWEFENTDKGRRLLIDHVKRTKGPLVAALESTGPYGLDLALALHHEKRFEVRYINPMAAKGYVKAGLVRSKTDRVDARVLARMAQVGQGVVWQPPSDHALELRGLTRRIRTLTNDRTREKNRLASGQATATTSEAVIADTQDSIEALDRRIAALRVAALAHARSDKEVAAMIDLLITIRGVAENTAVEFLGEVLCMPRDLTPKQLVAAAGLDPRAKQSGKKDSPRSISKMGSKFLRATLHMAAINGVRWCPEIKAFHDVLTQDRKKKELVSYVAVARKMLTTMHGMLKSKTPFEASKFYRPHQARQAA